MWEMKDEILLGESIQQLHSQVLRWLSRHVVNHSDTKTEYSRVSNGTGRRSEGLLSKGVEMKRDISCSDVDNTLALPPCRREGKVVPEILQK